MTVDPGNPCGCPDLAKFDDGSSPMAIRDTTRVAPTYTQLETDCLSCGLCGSSWNRRSIRRVKHLHRTGKPPLRTDKDELGACKRPLCTDKGELCMDKGEVGA